MTAVDLEEPGTAGAVLDMMLQDIAEHRAALEASVELAAKALYPVLWRELSWARHRVRDLEAENERLRAALEDQAPTVKLPAVRESTRRRSRRPLRRRAS